MSYLQVSSPYRITSLPHGVILEAHALAEKPTKSSQYSTLDSGGKSG